MLIDVFDSIEFMRWVMEREGFFKSENSLRILWGISLMVKAIDKQIKIKQNDYGKEKQTQFKYREVNH